MDRHFIQKKSCQIGRHSEADHSLLENSTMTTICLFISFIHTV